jgi:RNA polymerase sigma factor (sigma-70 family)
VTLNAEASRSQEPAAGIQAAARHPAGSADDEALFRQLVANHQQRLHRFVVKHIGWGSDAEDITQQAFMEAAINYASFKGESQLSTWLYGIAMNLVRNYLSRAPHRRYTFEDDESLNDTRADSPDPSEQLAQTQAIQALQAALDELPAEMRDVLLLVAHEELSYEDAAVMMSIPVGTVRSRVSRARTALRKRMTSQGIHLPF